jgi:hypothetical protein
MPWGAVMMFLFAEGRNTGINTKQDNKCTDKAADHGLPDYFAQIPRGVTHGKQHG